MKTFETKVADAMTVMLEKKVIAVLVKNGFNEANAVEMVKTNLDAALLMRPNASPAKLAEVVTYIA
jgi:hypothetical protein